jgi:hypothetical protein
MQSCGLRCSESILAFGAAACGGAGVDDFGDVGHDGCYQGVFLVF